MIDSTPAVTRTGSLRVADWLAQSTDTDELRGDWLEVPHGIFRATHGVAWHYMCGEDELIEVVSDQDRVFVYYSRRSATPKMLASFTIDLDDFVTKV